MEDNNISMADVYFGLGILIFGVIVGGGAVRNNYRGKDIIRIEEVRDLTGDDITDIMVSVGSKTTESQNGRYFEGRYLFVGQEDETYIPAREGKTDSLETYGIKKSFFMTETGDMYFFDGNHYLPTPSNVEKPNTTEK
jgi:hypothetical protein